MSPSAADREILEKFSSDFVQEYGGFTGGHNAMSITRLAHIFNNNTFGGKDITCLYYKASRINHSCVPNSTNFIIEKSGCIVIYSHRTIPAGSEITISYCPPCTPVGEKRRDFVCQCDFCVGRFILPQSLSNQYSLENIFQKYLELEKQKLTLWRSRESMSSRQFMKVLPKLSEVSAEIEKIMSALWGPSCNSVVREKIFQIRMDVENSPNGSVVLFHELESLVKELLKISPISLETFVEHVDPGEYTSQILDVCNLVY